MQPESSVFPAKEILGSRKSIRRGKLPLPASYDLLLQLFGTFLATVETNCMFVLFLLTMSLQLAKWMCRVQNSKQWHKLRNLPGQHSRSFALFAICMLTPGAEYCSKGAKSAFVNICRSIAACVQDKQNEGTPLRFSIC